MTRPIVLVGGGLAAQRCAETLRRCGHDGPLVMVCAEDTPPYDRPPLSKEFLAGEAHDLRLRPGTWYRDQDVELVLGTRATGIEDRRLLLERGGPIAFDRAVIATGADARRFPSGGDALTLRTIEDAERLRAAIRPGAHLAIVGGGLIGLEVAATAIKLGATATVIERGPAPMSVVLGTPVARELARFHEAHGVRIDAGAGVGSLDEIDADAVLVAIGGVPATGWLGLPGGIDVDLAQRTSLPHVLAAGDCVRGTHDHWEAAARQGANAARTILGKPIPAEPPASFWSDQHGVRLHLVGETHGADVVHADGDLAGGDATVTYTRRGVPIGVLLAGRSSDLPAARRTLMTATTPERTAA